MGKKPKRAARKETRRESQEHASREMNRDALNLAERSDIDWYVVFVMSGKEFSAHKILQQHAQGVYLPLHWRWRGVNRYVRGKRHKGYPALPGSLFLGFQRGEERWFNIRQQGVARGVLGIGGCPVAISGECLLDFINRNEDKFDVPDQQQYMVSHGEFEVGDRVRMVKGPFEGFVVDVQSIQGRNARVVAHIFEGIQDMVVSLDMVERVA